MYFKTNPHSLTILHEAVRNNHPEIAQFIIENAPRLIYENDSHRKSAAFIAAECGNLQCLQLLHKPSMDINSKAGHKTALEAALENKKWDTSLFILINLPDDKNLNRHVKKMISDHRDALENAFVNYFKSLPHNDLKENAINNLIHRKHALAKQLNQNKISHSLFGGSSTKK